MGSACVPVNFVNKPSPQEGVSLDTGKSTSLSCWGTQEEEAEPAASPKPDCLGSTAIGMYYLGGTFMCTGASHLSVT